MQTNSSNHSLTPSIGRHRAKRRRNSWQRGVAYSAIGVSCFFFLAPANAQVVLSDNLAAKWPGGPFSGYASIVDSTTWQAQEFTTDAHEYSLDSVTLGFRADAGWSPAPTLDLMIYADDGGMPGSLIGLLTSPDMSAGVPSFAMFTASGIDLAPSNVYWVVLSSPDGSFTWDVTEDLTGNGVGLSTNSTYSTDGGATWQVPRSWIPDVMQVVATPVPEPGASAVFSSFAILALGIFACKKFGRRSAHRSSINVVAD